MLRFRFPGLPYWYMVCDANKLLLLEAADAQKGKFKKVYYSKFSKLFVSNKLSSSFSP